MNKNPPPLPAILAFCDDWDYAEDPADGFVLHDVVSAQCVTEAELAAVDARLPVALVAILEGNAARCDYEQCLQLTWDLWHQEKRPLVLSRRNDVTTYCTQVRSVRWDHRDTPWLDITMLRVQTVNGIDVVTTESVEQDYELRKKWFDTHCPGAMEKLQVITSIGFDGDEVLEYLHTEVMKNTNAANASEQVTPVIPTDIACGG